MTSAQTTLAADTVPAARSAAKIAHPGLEDRRAQGRDAEDRIPPSSHAD